MWIGLRAPTAVCWNTRIHIHHWGRTQYCTTRIRVKVTNRLGISGRVPEIRHTPGQFFYPILNKFFYFFNFIPSSLYFYNRGFLWPWQISQRGDGVTVAYGVVYSTDVSANVRLKNTIVKCVPFCYCNAVAVLEQAKKNGHLNVGWQRSWSSSHFHSHIKYGPFGFTTNFACW